jgi:hypothetical protein
MSTPVIESGSERIVYSIRRHKELAGRAEKCRREEYKIKKGKKEKKRGCLITCACMDV